MAQPHKGNRRQIKCRVDVELYDAAQQRADALGVPMSEFLAHALAMLMHRPQNDPLHHTDPDVRQLTMTA